MNGRGKMPITKVITTSGARTSFSRVVTSGRAAHGDKVSVGCKIAVFNAAAVLEEFLSAVSQLAAACEDDLLEHCGEVEIGEGRVATCLLDHEEEVNEACKQALEASELEIVDE